MMKDKSFLTFLLVGVINSLVGLSVIYFCLHALSLHYWAATFIGNTVGACVSYLLNKRFTFRSNAKFVSSSIRFVIIILLSYLIAYQFGLWFVEALMKKLTWMAGYSDEIAVLFGSGFYTILNYFGQKYIVFSHKYQQQETRSIK